MRHTKWMAITAGLAMSVAMTGCSGGSEQGMPQAQKGQPAAAEKPEETAKKVAEEYAASTVSFMNSRGQEIQGTALASEADVRSGVEDLACPKVTDGLVTQWQQFSQMRQEHPDPNDKYWDGVGTVEATVENLQVNGESGTFQMHVVSNGETQKRGNLTLSRQNGTWEVCVAAPPPQ